MHYLSGKVAIGRAFLTALVLVALPFGVTSCGEDNQAKRDQEALAKALRESGDSSTMTLLTMMGWVAAETADDFDCSTNKETRQVEATVTVTNEEEKNRSFKFTVGVESLDRRFDYGNAVLSIKNIQPGETKSGAVSFLAREIPDGSLCRLTGVE